MGTYEQNTESVPEDVREEMLAKIKAFIEKEA